MVTKDQTDYAAAYRQYCTYGRGRSLKQFCEDEDFNYSKLSKYVNKSFWTLPKSERIAIECRCTPLEIEPNTESSATNDTSVTIMEEVSTTLSPIRYISHLLKTLPTLGTVAERRNLLPCYCQL